MMSKKEAIAEAKKLEDLEIERKKMTEEEEYRNAGITKEKAETSSKEWIKGYKEWKQNQKERCPHN